MMNNNDIGLFEKMFDVNIDELLQKIKNTFDEKIKKSKY